MTDGEVGTWKGEGPLSAVASRPTASTFNLGGRKGRRGPGGVGCGDWRVAPGPLLIIGSVFFFRYPYSHHLISRFVAYAVRGGLARGRPRELARASRAAVPSDSISYWRGRAAYMRLSPSRASRRACVGVALAPYHGGCGLARAAASAHGSHARIPHMPQSAAAHADRHTTCETTYNHRHSRHTQHRHRATAHHDAPPKRDQTTPPAAAMARRSSAVCAVTISYWC